jgi:hypothetical protein
MVWGGSPWIIWLKPQQPTVRNIPLIRLFPFYHRVILIHNKHVEKPEGKCCTLGSWIVGGVSGNNCASAELHKRPVQQQYRNHLFSSVNPVYGSAQDNSRHEVYGLREAMIREHGALRAHVCNPCIPSEVRDVSRHIFPSSPVVRTILGIKSLQANALA